MKMSRAVLSAGLAFGLCGAAWAGAPATGLGQQWPNAADLSRSPHYHVYTFNGSFSHFDPGALVPCCVDQDHPSWF